MLDQLKLKIYTTKMENLEYSELKEYLKNVLKTARKLGLSIIPSGGYSMGYDMNNLPPYPVGLFGALSIVEGPGARCKLGLTFDQTQSLEAGFNSCIPNAKNRKKKKQRSFKIDSELVKIGAELATAKRRSLRGQSTWAGYDHVVAPLSFADFQPADNKKLAEKILEKQKLIQGIMMEAQPAPKFPALNEIANPGEEWNEFAADDDGN